MRLAEDVALVDCGMGDSAEPIVERVRAVGCDPTNINYQLLTHYHVDHGPGAARFRELLGLEVCASQVSAGALEKADYDAIGFHRAQELGLFASVSTYPPCPVDRRLNPDHTMPVSRLRVRFLPTPGHCDGHARYLVEGGERTYLLSGDALFAGGRNLLLATPDCHLQSSLDSLRSLSGLEFDVLLPGHGPIVLTGGHEHLSAALDAIDRPVVPANLG